MTFDEDKVNAFEKSPCGLIGIWPLRPVPDEFRGAPGEPGGYYASRGNCTAPNECTCWCDLGVPLFRDGFTPSTRVGVVFFSISRPFGPRRATAMLRAGVKPSTSRTFA